MRTLKKRDNDVRIFQSTVLIEYWRLMDVLIPVFFINENKGATPLSPPSRGGGVSQSLFLFPPLRGV
jgi:IS4 transposase